MLTSSTVSFSYYLMRGMEGDADANKDGKITLGEMQAYLSEGGKASSNDES